MKFCDMCIHKDNPNCNKIYDCPDGYEDDRVEEKERDNEDA